MAPGAGEADCIVLDVHMPGLSGLDLQQALHQRGATVPVVFVTGHGDAGAQLDALDSGAVAFLKKPFTDQELLAAVARALGISPAVSSFQCRNIFTAQRKRIGGIQGREPENRPESARIARISPDSRPERRRHQALHPFPARG